MGKRKRWESAELNNRTYDDFYCRLKELSLNAIEWVNLPETMNQDIIEESLFDSGKVLFFNDPDIGHLALPCVATGRVNIYGIPTERRVQTASGYSRTLTDKNSVLVYNNYLKTPSHGTMSLFANRLYEIQRAIDVNVKGQKTPVMILSTEAQRLTMKNLFMQYDGNEPFIFADKNLDLNTVTALRTDSPYVADRLEILKHQVWNEALTFLGIENSNADKRERLVSDEVGSNYGNVEAQRNVFLNPRRKGADLYNEMYGLDIEVRFRSDLATMVNMDNIDMEIMQEVENE